MGRLSIAVLAAACALAPGSAGAIASRPSDGDLSPRLAELAKPSLRSAPRAEQAEALSLAPDGPGSLLRKGNRVLVDVRFDHGAAAGLDGLRAAGARIVHLSRRYQTVTVAAKPVELPGVADVARVQGVTEVLAPIVSATPGPVTAVSSCAGVTTSEGDFQLGAASARSGFNVDGSGGTVGILSDSFDADGTAPTDAAADIASGDLPGPGNPCGRSGPVSVLDDYAPSEPGDPDPVDEGRGMAQIVHDLAPGASLSFATAFHGELSFADNIRALANAGAKVIVDDVLYFDEPFFQDGPVAVAVNDVTAKGVAYFSSAGNSNLISGGNDIASWEAPSFREAIGCPPGLTATFGYVNQCLDFDPDPATSDPTFGITVADGATLRFDLQWAEPWDGVRTDIDVYLLDASGNPVLVEGEEVRSEGLNVEVSQEPFEFLFWENTTGSAQEVQVAINRYTEEEGGGVGVPRVKSVLLQNGGGVTATEYPTSTGGDTVGPTIFGHNGAGNAVSTGAVRYNNSSTLEAFSSRGPVTHYFGPVVGTSPAPPLGSAQVLAKPDLVATNGGANTFFGSSGSGVWRFFGTSASAPHAAAVAALMREANPSLSPAQIRAALAGAAHPVGAFGADAVGAGLVDAVGAVSSVARPPTVSITRAPAPLSRNRMPSIGFTANRPVSFSCSIDAGAPQSCGSPFTPVAPLSDGQHGFAAIGTDIGGRVGTSGTVLFTVDTRRPRTFFRKRPRKLIRIRRRKARVVFRFRSNEKGVVFICKVDRGLLRFCKNRIVRRFGVGKRVVRVKALDAAGNVDRTPAVYRFRVKRRRGHR